MSGETGPNIDTTNTADMCGVLLSAYSLVCDTVCLSFYSSFGHKKVRMYTFYYHRLFFFLFIHLTLEFAELTLKNGEVPVGCILVYESEKTDVTVSFTGGNEVSEFKNATRHAELVAFDKAAEYAYRVYFYVVPFLECRLKLKMMR